MMQHFPEHDSDAFEVSVLSPRVLIYDVLCA